MKRLSVRVNTAAAAFREMLPTCSISLAGEVPRRRARAFKRGELGCESCPYACLDSHTRCVLSAHMSAHLSLFQHNHHSCPVLLEQCRALESQARQQSPCLVRTESAALFSSDTDFSPSPTCAKGLRLTVPRSVPAGSRLVSGVLTALVLVLPLRSSPCEVRRHAMSRPLSRPRRPQQARRCFTP